MEEKYFDQLRKELKKYGYENPEYPLQIASNNEHIISVTDVRTYGGDKMSLNWASLRKKDEEFKLKWLTAQLELDLIIPDIKIGEFDVLTLDKLMHNINWNSGETYEQLDDPKQLPYQLLTGLNRLEVYGGIVGKEIRDILLYKHLSHTAYQYQIVSDMDALKEKFCREVSVELPLSFKLFPDDMYHLLNGRFVLKNIEGKKNEAGIWYKADFSEKNAKGVYGLEKTFVAQGFNFDDAFIKAGAQYLHTPLVKDIATTFLSLGELMNLTVNKNGFETTRAFYIDPEKGILVVDQKESAKRGLYDQMPKEIAPKEDLGTIKINPGTTMEEIWKKLNQSKGGTGEDPSSDKGKSR